MPEEQAILILSAEKTVSETIVEAATMSLAMRGDDASPGAVIVALSEAIALAVFSGAPDPSDRGMRTRVMSAVTQNVCQVLDAACARVDRMVN